MRRYVFTWQDKKRIDTSASQIQWLTSRRACSSFWMTPGFRKPPGAVPAAATASRKACIVSCDLQQRQVM